MRSPFLQLLLLPLLALLAPGAAQATTLVADTYFTLRTLHAVGPALALDDSPGAGFLGLVTNLSPNRTDHTHWEFDMAPITGPVQSASLDFTMDFAEPADDFFVHTYEADGIASLGDYQPPDSPSFATFPGSTNPISVDITSVINASLGFSHVGFFVSVDPGTGQGFFGFDADPVSLNFELVPEPGTGALVIAALACAAASRRRERVAVAGLEPATYGL